MTRTVSLEQQSRHATLMVQDAEWLHLNLAEFYDDLESQITDVVSAALIAREQIEGNQPKSYEHTTFTTALWRLRCTLHDIAYEGEDVPVQRYAPIDETVDDVEGAL